MADDRKTKAELLNELAAARARIKELEEHEANLRRAESQARELEEKYASLVRANPDAVTATDLGGTITFASARTVEIHGASAEKDLLGKNALELIAPEDRERAQANMARTMEEGLVRNAEYKLLRLDGSSFEGELDAALIKDAEGNATAFIAVTRDITARKRAEEALRESEEKFRNLAEESPNMICINQKGRILYVNKKAEEIIGYTREELYASDFDFFEVIAPDSCDAVKRSYETHLRGEEIPPYELSFVSRDGGKIDALLTSRLIKYEGEDAVLAIVTDVTEHKRAEDALRASEAQLRALQANIPVGLFRSTADRNGHLISSNPALAKMMGYPSPEDMAEESVAGFYFNASDRGRFIEEVSSAGVVSDYEVKLKRPDGSTFWGSLSARAVTDEEGHVAYLDGTLEDITERRRAIDTMKQTLRGSVDAISKIVEKRDPYTSGHQLRVARLARALAVELGLSEDQAEGIYMAAVVHDIGKISIPEGMLSKPGMLNELEYNIIKSHPQVGCDILENVEFAWPITDYIIQHHERLDGSGYPFGLDGEEITIEARILSVADVVEAMSSHRPYRPALGLEAALDEVSEYKGILYDETVVDACLRLFHERDFEFA